MTPPQIDYGARARIGVLVPSGNSVAEPELRAMMPPGAGLLVTRLPLTGSSEIQLLAMLDTLETGTSLLADAAAAMDLASSPAASYIFSGES